MKLERTRVFRGAHEAGEVHQPEGGGPAFLDLRDLPLDAEAVAPVQAHLAVGGLLAYPTETVYGLGAPVTEAGIEALASLKGRDPDRPFLALVPDAAAAEELLWTPEARELAELFWPGALTLVLEDPTRSFPSGVRSHQGTVAVRVSPHPFVVALLELWGGPLLSTSANPPGEPPARSGHEAREVGLRLGADDSLLVVEVGTLPVSPPSTVVDCTGLAPVVLRQGSIPVSRLRCALPGLENHDD